MGEIIKTYRKDRGPKRYIVGCDNFWHDAYYRSLFWARFNAWVTAWLLFGGETVIIDREA